VKRHVYEICVDGHLGASWSPWLGNMSISQEEGGQTVLRGPLPDEPALHGVLAKIRDLGLPLVEVKRLVMDSPSPEEKEEPAL
jgi:hypothetical protein